MPFSDLQKGGIYMKMNNISVLGAGFMGHGIAQLFNKREKTFTFMILMTNHLIMQNQ